MANRFFKTKSLIGGNLLQTVLILAGSRTQVTFSGIIPLDHQDFCRYCQYSSSEQKQDCLYHIYAGAQPEMVLGRGGFLKLGYFNDHFHKKSRIKSPAAENVGARFLSQILLKLDLNGKFNLRMDKTGPFFPKPEHFFIFKKEQGGRLLIPPPSNSCMLDIKDFYMEQYLQSQNSICNCKSTGVTTYATIHVRIALTCILPCILRSI